MEKGIEKGRKEGEAKGKAEGKVEIAKKMLAKGMDLTLIANITDLNEDFIRSLAF